MLERSQVVPPAEYYDVASISDAYIDKMMQSHVTTEEAADNDDSEEQFN